MKDLIRKKESLRNKIETMKRDRNMELGRYKELISQLRKKFKSKNLKEADLRLGSYENRTERLKDKLDRDMEQLEIDYEL